MTGNSFNSFDHQEGHEDKSLISKHRALFLNAIKCLLRNRIRSTVVILCLIALLSPLVTALSICEGIKSQYREMLNQAGDVYVTGDNYGSNAPIDLEMIEHLQKIQGVTQVVPRVIGRTYVKGNFLAILGIDPEYIPASIRLAKGRAPKEKGDVIIGQGASEYLNLALGSRFSIKRNPEQVFQIVGLFHSPQNIWNVDLLVMNYEDASELFGIRGMATDLSVYTRPGYEQIVDVIARLSENEMGSGKPALRVQTRELIDRYTQRGFNMKAGLFTGLYCLVLALGIPSIGVISGFGLSERRREIGVMKALGWQTQEILEMVAMENLALSIISVPFIIIAAVVWIYPFNGVVIANFFIASLDIMIPFQVPSMIFPIPAIFGLMTAMLLTMVGSIYSTWKTATIPPSEAMKT